ncbi:separase isoform X3 [Daucus carota subsp. sativus]|uniref:separase isoform X3 n=1 Tax=Daucus carota subsp. sativus TaxID=79200 RepID=UPI0007EF9A3C|nr:PREDICTED: separase isoform X3 [Daucus carota subsp. sativus]
MDNSPEASDLLSKLESSPDFRNFYTLISSYLLPFTSTLTTSKPSKSSKRVVDNTRALAKQFLPFLNRCLSLIPKRLLSQCPKLDSSSALQLFDSYVVCLNCMDSVSSQLSGKAYAVHLQRVRLVHCYLFWERYGDASREGLSLLQSVCRLGGDGNRNEYVPDMTRENEKDHDFAWLVVEIVVSLVKCVAMDQSKVESDYRRLLVMISEVTPWFRILDANAYEKLHRVHVSYMSKCALILVDDLNDFDDKVARRFCLATFAELAKSSSKDQLFKFAHRLCYSLFSKEKNPSSVVDILACVLDSVANAGEVGTQTSTELLELVSYCATKSLYASSDMSFSVAEQLQKFADDICLVSPSPTPLLTSLYATGLFFSDFCGQTMAKGSTSSRTDKDSSIYGFLLYYEHRLQELTGYLQSLKHYYNSTKRISLHEDPDLVSYFNALKFLCKPLAEFVNSERGTIVTEIVDATSAAKLKYIQDALHQYLEIFILYQRGSEKKREANDGNNKTTLCVAVAAFILSVKRNQGIKESTTFIKNSISSDWIQFHGLKFLFSSLYNFGVVLYKNNNTKEASLSLKLCCRASWTCLLNNCKLFEDKSIEFSDEMSEDSIIGLLAEACTRSAFVLDVLYQCDCNKMNKLITYSLEKWAAAEKLFDRLPSPTALLKQWVKIQCKISKTDDVENNGKTLYSVLSSSVKMSKRAPGILLEQELLLYEEMRPLNPTFCRRMRMKIVDILLKEVYVTKTIQRSRVLIAKGRELRACGVERLDDCIECLSESISMMQSETNRSIHCDSIHSYYLANAYCLRALCTQEAEPDRKVLSQKRIFQDMDAAIKLWMSIDLPCLSGQIDMVFENILFLLYHVVDLLSLKGYMKFHANIYEIIIRLFEWRNVPVKKLLAILWECRRLGHALCASPVNETFITTLSNHCDASNTMEYWLSCLTESPLLEVGFKQNFSYMFTDFSLVAHHHVSSQAEITIDGVEQAVSNLLSSVPLSSGSASIAAHMYYDLGERLISNGQFIEALSYAKEAYQIRTKLFQEKFMYKIDQQSEVCNGTGEVLQKQCYSLKTLDIFSSVATAAWSSECVTRDFDSHVVTPWNVLQRYLESILQVGSIHEIVGNGSDAKRLLLWGKNISCFQDLPLFTISFSSVLGKLYCKEQLWEFAELELQKARHLLDKLDSWSPFYCCKCKLVLEVTIDQQLGDLSRGRCDDSNIGELSVDRLLYAEKRYRIALETLRFSEWKNSVSNPEETAVSGTGTSFSLQSNYLETKISFECCNREETKVDQEISRKSRKVAKILPKGQCLTRQQNRMMTRSCRKNIECDQEEKSKNKSKFPSSDAVHKNTKIVNLGSRASKEIKCWYCLPHDVSESGYLIDYIHMKWELVRRRLLLRVLTSIGKCSVIQNERQKGDEIFSESISVLVARNQFSPTYQSVPFSLKLDLIGSDIPGDALAVERATILYNLCWFILKYNHCKGTSVGSDFSGITISRIMAWLKLAFLICREVPVLFRKVSRLLAVLYICSSVKILSLPSSHSDTITASQWGSYFHQASLGTHFNQQLFSHKAGKQKGESFSKTKGCLSTSSSLGQETANSVRRTPDILLREFVSNFYQSLPPATIICISLLGVAYASLLRELSSSPASVRAWILFSRLKSDGQPVFLLLPADSILGGDETTSLGFLHESQSSVKRWHCPWGSTVVDDVAPVFKLILEQNYLSSSAYPLEDTKMTRSLWWTQRRKLDQYLGHFLRDIEEKWFGPWKFLFCSDWSDCKHLDLAINKLADDLKVKCDVNLHESLLRVILAGGQHACDSSRCVPNLILNNGCHVDGVECNIDEMSMVFKLILETIHEFEEDLCVNREPIILVLDHEIQMLPWESLPILRNQEVYRMPSICSIFASLDRHDHKKLGTGSMVFPSIDPLDAYYLLNPSGDLISTEVEFDKWFKDQNLEGKTGMTPTIEELTGALESHELFIYFGHGSGAQYIPNHEIQKLRTCAATLLMGCSSGSLSLSGSYSPQGAPLCYLIAGSPVIVANLWEVTDKDIDRFGKAMLDAWLRERSMDQASCAQCDAITDELKSLSISAAKGKGKKKTSRKILSAICDVSKCNTCRHRPKIGTFTSQAREACTLPFLIGASPVCYGVPTGIKKKVIL